MTALAKATWTGQGGSDTSRPTSRRGIAHNAASHKKPRVGNLYELRNEELRHDCWRDIHKHAADGVDRGSAEDYAQPLEEHIRDRIDRLTRQTSRAKRVRRHDIAQGEGRRRPLGIPAIEDKLVQLAVARILEAIYEQDFLRCTDGSRPQVGPLDAVRTRTITRQFGRDGFVVEADIKGCLDHASCCRLQTLTGEDTPRELEWGQPVDV